MCPEYWFSVWKNSTVVNWATSTKYHRNCIGTVGWEYEIEGVDNIYDCDCHVFSLIHLRFDKINLAAEVANTRLIYHEKVV